MGFDVANRTERPAVDDLLHATGEGVIAPVKGLDEHAARLLRGARLLGGLLCTHSARIVRLRLGELFGYIGGAA